MKTVEELKKENQDKMLAESIFTQWKLATLVHAGWHEFTEEAKSLETKIHTLWVESGREDLPTYDLGLWAQEQIEFKHLLIQAGN